MLVRQSYTLIGWFVAVGITLLQTPLLFEFCSTLVKFNGSSSVRVYVVENLDVAINHSAICKKLIKHMAIYWAQRFFVVYKD